MYDTNQPIDAQARAEAESIIRDKSNPLYEAFNSKTWHPMQKAAHEKVQSLYARAFPGGREIGSGLPPHLSDEAILGVKQPQPNPLAPKPSSQPNQQQPQQGGQVEISPMWDYDQQQGERALRELEPYRWPEILATANDAENFRLMFSDFLKTPEDHTYLTELLRGVGNHPRGYQLYHHLVQKLKGGA